MPKGTKRTDLVNILYNKNRAPTRNFTIIV